MRPLLLLVLLVGRIGAFAAEPAKSDGPANYHLKKGDVVLFLGDSITAETKYWYKIYFDDIAKTYPELIEGEKPKYNGAGWGTPALKFVNGGVSGDTAAAGLARLPKLLEQHKPTVCVVCFGMNDRYKDRENYLANMRAIVKKLKEAKVDVTILTSPSVCSLKHSNLQPFVKILDEMAKEVQTLAAEEKVGFADSFTPTKKIQDDHKRDFTWGDGIHPNEEGHRAMATALQETWGYGKPLVKQTDPRTAPKVPQK
ncbi:MAG TPA: GDSL-type esterase/lipase family protein [Planctomycetota bacterium]|nr:GDSL-type esterase/lipase family protein [Planctomycetota bacterium]